MSPEIPVPVEDLQQSQAGGRRASDKTGSPQKGTGTAIAEAIGAGAGAAASLLEKSQSHSMGLKGTTAMVGNLTAVAFVCGMFFFMFREWAAGQREERLMMYNQLRDQRDSDAKRSDSSSTDIRALTTEVRAGNELIRANNELTRALIQKIDIMITARQEERLPPPRTKPPQPAGKAKDGEEDAIQKRPQRGVDAGELFSLGLYCWDDVGWGYAVSRPGSFGHCQHPPGTHAAQSIY